MKKLILVFVSVFLIFNWSYSQQLRADETWRVPVQIGSQTVLQSNDSLFLSLRLCRLRVLEGLGEISMARKCDLIVAGKKISDIEYSVTVYGWPNGTELEIYARWSGRYNQTSEVRNAVVKDMATHCLVSK